MILLLRGLARLVTFLLLLALAAAGLAVLVGVFDLSWATSTLGLPRLRDTVGSWFDALAADGPVAVFSALGAAAAILLGVLLLVGLLVPPRERLVELESTDAGALTARRRPLSQLATALTDRVRGVTESQVKVRPNRRSGGRVEVRADLPRTAEADPVRDAITERLTVLTEPFKLASRVRTRRGDRGSRVQ